MTRYTPPSPKMVNYVRNLARERVYLDLGDTPDERAARVDHFIEHQSMDKFGFMDLIDQLKAAPRDTQTGDNSLKPGVYQRNGDVYLVKFNRDKTGLYAKRLVPISGTRVTESDVDVKADWDYQPGMINLIRPTDLMTLAEAEPFLIRYTHCMCCGRFLKAAKSVRQSIGPVCVKMFQEPKVTPQLDVGTSDRLADLLDQLKAR